MPFSDSLAVAPRRVRSTLHSRPALLIAFAFAVMADPVSSVAYAIEAALRALHGDLGLLLRRIAVVVVIIALVIIHCHQLVARFPEGGRAAAAAGRAFGEAWAFIPIAALHGTARPPTAASGRSSAASAPHGVGGSQSLRRRHDGPLACRTDDDPLPPHNDSV